MSSNVNYIQNLNTQLEPLRKQIVAHSLYNNVHSVQDLTVFMQYHVFAVFDFMSLLKALQNMYTQTHVPWTPKGDPKIRRFINEIVLGEESDLDAQGNTMSHFEMYLQAMQQANANTQSIESFIGALNQQKNISEALQIAQAPQAIKDFVNFTFSIINTNEAHKIAAVFTFGREDLIPNMFLSLVKNIQNQVANKLDKFVYYLERHIELDGDEHGPIALQMISELCGDDANKWEDCLQVSKQALLHRKQLWDGALQEIKNKAVLTS